MVFSTNLDGGFEIDKGSKHKFFWGFLALIIVIIIASYFIFFRPVPVEGEPVPIPEELVPIEGEPEGDFILKAVVKKNISICTKGFSENEENCFNTYYFYMTLWENKNYCEFTKETHRSMCLAIYNQVEVDVFCNEALSEEDMTACRALFEPPGESCNIIDDVPRREFCEDSYYLIKGIKEKDIDSCDQLKNERFRLQCFSLNKACDRLKEDENRELCLRVNNMI